MSAASNAVPPDSFAMRSITLMPYLLRAVSLPCFFSVAEHQEGPPSVLISQFFGYGVDDGIVKRCAEVARFFPPEFREMPAIVLIAIQAIQNLGARLGEVPRQAQMVSEAQHEGPVLWPKDILKEHLQVVLVLLGEMILAAAGIDNQSESERHVGTSGEESNFLRNRVLKNLEVVLGQVFDQCPAGIPYREGHTDKVDLDANRLLRKTDGSQQCKHQRGTSHADI